MNKAEALASVMMANFEASRLEQIKMLVDLTDNFQYHHFLETKNNLKINHVIDEQRNTLIKKEHDAFTNVAQENPNKVKLHNIELLDARKNVDDYIIALNASNEMQSQIKNIMEENNQLKNELTNLRQSQRF